jgi:type II secretory pathway predicted ATPase ExeA
LSSPALYLKHFGLKRVPFRQQPDPEVFFAEAGRDEILQELCADIVAGKPLVKLTGGEGVGKTLLCQLLARKLGIKKFQVVCLEHPVGSFEDLVRTVRNSINGHGDQEAENEAEHAGLLPELLAKLRGKNKAGQRVVLLVDEAEKLFLATLERLVRLVAEIEPENLLQVVLVGRLELDRNLQQLSNYCAHVEMLTGYTLEPLGLLETERYICFRLFKAGGSAAKMREIFSGEAVAALQHGTKGNLSLANLLAEQGLARAYESGMFQVGEEMVSPSQDRARSYSFNQAQFMAGLKKYRLQVLAGALLVLALLLAVLGPEKETRIPPATPTETVAGQEKVHSPAQAEAEKVPVVAAEEPKGAAKSVVPSSPPAEKSVVAQEGESLVPDAREGDSDVREVLPERAVLPEPSAKPPGEKASISVPADVPAFPEPVAAEQQTEPVLVIESVPEILSPPERKIVVLQADGRKRKVAEGGDVKQSAARAAGNPEQLFAERLRASAKWQARAGYTIQLMALASDSAEESFKALLAQDRYKAVQDQLYVVRKASPPTLFVYYGFFESMEKARQARDRFPDFLRKNQPYPLAIDRASKKAGG